MHQPIALIASQAAGGNALWVFAIIGVFLLLLLFFVVFVVKQYKRCPSNRVLVIYGKVGAQAAAKCMHGGGAFVIPLIQDYAYLSLEPLVIEIPLEGALSLNNIRVNVPSTFTVGISTDEVLMNNAAERLLMLDDRKIRDQAQDIILGQLRLVIATLSIEEINKDREKFMNLINENVAQEVNKIGLELINVNIRDITDESGYIVAIGQRAAAEAINRAKVEVAEQERDGAVGQALAERDMHVTVSEREAETVVGRKRADQEQRIKVSEAERDGAVGEAHAQRDMRVAVAEREAETVVGRKKAEQEQRIQVSDAESLAVDGENTARATIADSNAKLAEIKAEARRRSDVAAAEAAEAILKAEREQEIARLGKETLAPQEIEKQRIEIAAEAEAERLRRVARGDADAILARYMAEAEGTQKVLEAKAAGYRELVEACGANAEIAPTLLMIEQLPTLVAEQVKAISNLKIDKITVWDSGGGGNGKKGATADFLAGLIGSLPAMHELADQAGIELPQVLGRMPRSDGPLDDTRFADTSGHASPAGDTTT